MDFSSISCWAIADGAAGHRSQVRGLAEGLTLRFEEFDCRVRFPWKILPPGWIPLREQSFKVSRSLFAEPPQVAICCGKQAAMTTLSLKRKFGNSLFSICLQDPKFHRSTFDLIIAPEHDQLLGENVISTLGAMHPLTTDRLNQIAQDGLTAGLQKLEAKFTAVLVGGPNKYYAFDDADVLQLINNLKRIASAEHQLAIIPSRRTPEHAKQSLIQAFNQEHFVWNGEGENPYLPALAFCSSCVVTSDSVSMLSEATTTGRPVYLAILNEKRPALKFRYFHQRMIDEGYVREFSGEIADWCYEPPQETKRVSEIVQERLQVFLHKD